MTKQNMCDGTGVYFSMLWAQDMPCWGCAGCWFSRWVDMWRNLGAAIMAKDK